MGKKNYITEISDAFGLKNDSKQALKLVKKIKSAQASAYPSKQYKKTLLAHLENTHLIDEAESSMPRFSLFQIFGAFASFVCITGATFMLFDVGHDSEQATISIQEDVGISEQSDYSDINAAQTEQSVESGEEMQPLSSPEEKEFTIERFERDEAQDGVSVSESMMMSDTLDPEIQDMSFADICSEYDGILSDDAVYCIIEEDVLCEEHNIYECAEGGMKIQRDDTLEIDLQELIDTYGQ